MTSHEYLAEYYNYNSMFSLSEIPMNGVGCNKSSECITPRAVCTSFACKCPQTDFYNGTHCVDSK